MHIKPTQSNLHVTIKPRDSSILMPDGKAPTLPYAEVVAAGPDCRMNFTPGTKVLFRMDEAIGLGKPDDKVQNLIIPESAVFCTLEGEDQELITIVRS